MKNAFDANLPKSNPKIRSSVSTLTAPTPAPADPADADPRARHARPRRREDLRPTAPVVAFKPPASRAPRGPETPEARRARFALFDELETQINQALESRDSS